MKAVIFKSRGQFEIVDREVPAPGPGEVLVKVAYCGICGSDLHLVDMGMLPRGAVIGHELSGHVAAIGPEVTGWGEGDPVVVMPLDPCGQCSQCKTGDTQRCADGMKRSYGLGVNPGGFAEYMLVKTSALFPLPDGLDLKTAALNEPWAVAVHAVDLLELDHDPLTLIMGAGPIGLLCLYALKLRGATKVHVSEPDPYRADKARAAGAVSVIDPKASKPGSVLSAAAGRLPDLVIDCVGTESSTSEAIAIAGAGGHVTVLGVHMGKIGILPIVCFGKELSFNFSFGYRADEFGAALQSLASGVIDYEVVVSDVLPLAQTGAAFDLLHQSGHTKILIDCQDAQ